MFIKCCAQNNIVRYNKKKVKIQQAIINLLVDRSFSMMTGLLSNRILVIFYNSTHLQQHKIFGK